jgi:hypothetical protein
MRIVKPKRREDILVTAMKLAQPVDMSLRLPARLHVLRVAGQAPAVHSNADLLAFRDVDVCTGEADESTGLRLA